MRSARTPAGGADPPRRDIGGQSSISLSCATGRRTSPWSSSAPVLTRWVSGKARHPATCGQARLGARPSPVSPGRQRSGRKGPGRQPQPAPACLGSKPRAFPGAGHERKPTTTLGSADLSSCPLRRRTARPALSVSPHLRVRNLIRSVTVDGRNRQRNRQHAPREGVSRTISPHPSTTSGAVYPKSGHWSSAPWAERSAAALGRSSPSASSAAVGVLAASWVRTCAKLRAAAAYWGLCRISDTAAAI